MNLVIWQLAAAVEEIEFDYEPEPGDCPAYFLHEPCGRGRGTAGSEHIVDDQDALPGSDGVAMNLDAVCTVFEVVFAELHLVGQLFGFADGNEAGAKRKG